MKRSKELRAPPKEWIKILQMAYFFLKTKYSIGDLVLFGSQALSIYMKSPLRSKDIDFLSAQISLNRFESLSAELLKLPNVQFKSTTVQTKMLKMNKMRTYAIELRVADKPFFVESFDRILDGRPPSILAPYLDLKKKWKLEIWVPEREATLALRLAFRPPEGISRFNAIRLNNFMRENRRSIKFRHLASIIADWKIEKWIESNLVDLYQRNKLRIIDDDRIIPGIQDKIKPKKVANSPLP
ncbi:MAG: hypothetical protein ABSD41_11800 [Candidatus Bathyarchaeia archaeon]|jgi:hypothetical protein